MVDNLVTTLERQPTAPLDLGADGLWSELDRALLGDEPPAARLSRCFSQVRTLLSSAREPEVLDTLSAALGFTADDRRELCADLDALDHVGFLVPARSDPAMLAATAAEAGFRSDHTVFPSAVFARELGALAGRDRVETSIFKAYGRTNGKRAPGEKIGVEVFVPDERPEIVSGWLARGVGTHVALRARSYDSVFRIQRLLERRGCRLPEFMNGRPMENRAEGVLIFYVDFAAASGHLRRLELCYQDGRRTSTPGEDLS